MNVRIASADRPAVLVIDDEPKVARLVRHTLGADGFEILYAADGTIGIEMIEAERPDLVLLDVMMPRLNGLQTCRRIREISDVPVIMLTALGAEAERVQGLELGADDYIVKPFSPAELAARIRAVLRRVRPDKPPPAAYDDGTLRIDFARRMVTLRGEPVLLSRTELRLLRVLGENPGHVVLHEELQARVWGRDYGASNEQLRTYIKYLRRKIEPDVELPRYILTQAGVGYLFRAHPSTWSEPLRAPRN